ncbi:hypothetical protein GCM10009123_17090 [Kangiella japonica]|uniref:SHOCT domain-containing protein n=1 Tax=Kangiella japonica TaxID=647384 RepID=A0ABN0T2L2_9GAMM
MINKILSILLWLMIYPLPISAAVMDKPFSNRADFIVWSEEIARTEVSLMVSSGCFASTIRDEVNDSYAISLQKFLININPMPIYDYRGYMQLYCESPLMHIGVDKWGEYYGLEVSSINSNGSVDTELGSRFFPIDEEYDSLDDFSILRKNYSVITDSLHKQDVSFSGYNVNYASDNVYMVKQEILRDINNAVNNHKKYIQEYIQDHNGMYLLRLSFTIVFWSVILFCGVILLLRAKNRLSRKKIGFRHSLKGVIGGITQRFREKRHHKNDSIRIKKGKFSATYSVSEELMRWADLKEKGVITEDEFNQAKKELLERKG